MLEYDSKIIYGFAERLYAQASRIVATYTIVGVLLGFLVGWLGSNAAGYKPLAIVAGTALALLLGVVGYSNGQQKAFGLRLSAQTALCNVRIEENTRAGRPIAN